MSSDGLQELMSCIKRRWQEQLVFELNRKMSFTGQEIYSGSLEIVSRLQEISLGKKIVLLLGNRTENFMVRIACLLSGKTCVPVNPDFKWSEIDKILSYLSDYVIVTDKETQSQFQGLGDDENCLFVDDLVDVKNLKLVEYQREENIESPVGDIMFTSGTTGQPKGVNIHIDRLAGNGKLFIDLHKIPKGCVFYNVLPLCYLGGWYNLFLIPVLAGGSVVLDKPFGSSNMYAFWKNVQQFKVSHLWFNPTMLSMLLHIGLDEGVNITESISSIKKSFVGMAPLDPQLKKRFEKQFDLKLLENFGLSETLFLTSEREGVEKVPGSVGPVIHPIEIDLVGEQKEVVVRSPFTIERYFGDDASPQAFSKEGFRTGDIGQWDEHGNLHIVGRIKDIIIRGGINISPSEIEKVIAQLPECSAVTVIGCDDEMLGEKVVAVVGMTRGDQREIKKLIKEKCRQELASFKRPEKIYFVDQFPLNASGKIDRKALKENIMKMSH